MFYFIYENIYIQKLRSNDKYQAINISRIFRSDYSDPKYPGQPPSTPIYTVIRLGEAYIMFWAAYLLYAIILTIIKCYVNEDFQLASGGEKFQHIVEALNIPEAFKDWDENLDLDLEGHLKKWKKVLLEMMIMVFMQLLTNICLLVPFLITGMKKILFIHATKKMFALKCSLM